MAPSPTDSDMTYAAQPPSGIDRCQHGVEASGGHQGAHIPAAPCLLWRMASSSGVLPTTAIIGNSPLGRTGYKTGLDEFHVLGSPLCTLNLLVDQPCMLENARRLS